MMGNSKFSSINLESLLGRFLCQLLAFGKPSLSILIYHRVLDSEDFLRPGDPTQVQFNWQMRLLSECFVPLSLATAIDKLKCDQLPARAVCVTFDDGYADNERLALPILKRWGVPATVFVSSDYLNGGCMWNDAIIEALRHINLSQLKLSGLGVFSTLNDSDKLKAAAVILPVVKYWSLSRREDFVMNLWKKVPESSTDKRVVFPDLMMSDAQVRNLCRQGVEIGGHTLSHPILSTITDKEVRKEVEGNKEYLEKLINRKVRFFAYPNGKAVKDYTTKDVDTVKEVGFEAAVTTEAGCSEGGADLWQLPRFTPWDKCYIRFLVRLLMNNGKGAGR